MFKFLGNVKFVFNFLFVLLLILNLYEHFFDCKQSVIKFAMTSADFAESPFAQIYNF